MQIIENKHLIPNVMARDEAVIKESCRRWREWHANSMNHWNWDHPDEFQDDSGV